MKSKKKTILKVVIIFIIVASFLQSFGYNVNSLNLKIETENEENYGH